MKQTLAFVLFLNAAASLQMHGATATWDGTLNATWNADNGSDSNWAGGAGTLGKPLSPDLLVFTGTANTTNTNDLANLTQFNGITFNNAAGAFVLGGNSITLGGNVANDSTNPQIINNALTYTAVRTFATTSGPVTLGGVLSGGAASGLLKTGANTLTLTGSGTIGNAGAGGIFPLNLREGALVLNGGAFTVTGEAAIGDNTAAGGAGNNVSLTLNGGSLAVSSWFSVARANGVGAVSSDVVLNNAASITTVNLGGGYNNNSALNLPKGSLTLNNTSAFTVTNNGVAFNFGESPGSNVSISLNDSATFTAQGGTAARSRIGQAGKGVFKVNSPTATANLHAIQLGAGAGVGAFINKGNLTLSAAANIGTDILAVSQGTGYGYFRNDNGAATTPTVTAQEVGFGGSASNGGTAVVDIASGTFSVGSWFAMNRNQAAVAGDSQLNITGGTLNLANTNTTNHVNWGITGSTQTGTINVTGTGTLGSGGPLTDLSLQSGNAAGATGILTIGTGGTVQVNSLNSEAYFAADGVATTAGSSFVNFNGGTLKANAASDKLLAASLTGVYIHAGGATINTNTFNSTLREPLLSPAGNGLTSIPVTTPGVGYVGRPHVKITGGGGVGASAMADFDPATGAVTGVTITSPGSGYTSVPTVTLVGGGPTTAAALGTVTIGSVAGGNLTKKGLGSLSIAAVNTFTGSIIVNEGKLVIAGTQANPTIVNTGASLVVNDPLTPAAQAALTVPSLTLDNGSIVELDASSADGWNEQITVTTPSTGLNLGTASITLHEAGTNNKFFKRGTYNLINYGTAFVGNVSGLTVANPVDDYTYVFSASAGIVKLTISFTDTDNDGMPNSWETANGTNPLVNDANANPDGDFSTNLEEYLAGTNPQSATSDPKNTDGDSLRDDWEISNFGNITARDGTGDYDGDLATDLEEFLADTYPLDANSWPDKDASPDNMDDAWEVRYFGNLSKTGTADTDGDGYTDLQEFQAHTSPVDPAWTPVKSQLIHRWSFTGNLNDSVSGVTGVTQSPALIVDPNGATDSAAVVQNATSVTLTGGPSATSDYVQLGSNLLGSRTPATASSTFAPVSIELWATQISVMNWARIFDFGSSQNEYLFMSWTNANTLANNNAEWKDYETKAVANTATPYALNAEYHIVFTIEPAMGIDGKTRVTYYAAPTGAANLGAVRGTFETTNNLTNLTDTICALGRSSFAGDAVAHATYNEVRMWNGALPTTERELLHDLGPDIANLTDSDNDGLVDAWEVAKFGNITAQTGTGDPDGDTFNNLAEQAGHSSPTQAASTPADSDGDGLADAWEITNFQSLVQTGTGDPDGDLATNEQEETAGTDPNNAASYPDVDQDLLKDAWEIFYFGSITARDGTLDYDNDGFTDKQEFDAGSNPVASASKPAVFVQLPATGTDAASGIAATKTYTHAIDFGATVTPVSVNSVAFHQASVPATGNDNTNNDFWNSVDNTGGRNGSFSLAKSVANDWAQNNGNAANVGADGSMLELLTDFANVSGTAAQLPAGASHTLTLGSLTPGLRYSTRLYYRPWTPSSNRNTLITFDGDGTNITQQFNQDAATGASAGYLQYDFTANDTDITIKFALNNDLGSGWHEYVVTNEVVATAGDTDLDGLPDQWELDQFGNLQQGANDDPDHDGTGNRAEYLLGLKPTDARQWFHATKGAITPGSSATITWPAKPGLKFTVSRSTTLANGSWVQLGDPITTTTDLGTYTDLTAPTGKAFYRVQLQTP